MTKLISSSTDDVLLDWDAMGEMFIEQGCWLVALDDWEISLLLSLLRYAHWATRWVNLADADWDDVEAAVSQLEACLMSGCDVSILNENLEAVIEELSSITAAINGLELSAVCSPTITVNTPAVVNCATQGTGEESPSGPADEEQEPPAGWTDGNPEIEDRKCKVANYIYDNLYYLLTKFDEYNIPEWTVGTGALTATVIGIVIGLSSGPVVVIIAIVGALSVLVLSLLAVDLDLSGLVVIMEDAHTNLVCALYSSTTADEARYAMEYTLGYSGASASQIALINAMLINDVVNSLFYQREGAYGEDFETALETYETEISCNEECGECPEMTIENGTRTSGTWQDGYYASVQSGSYHYITYFLNSSVPNYGYACGPYRPTTVWATEGMTPAVHKYFRIFGDDYPNMIYNSNVPPDAICGRAVALTSATPFTAHILIGDDC